MLPTSFRSILSRGLAIPASPLALTPNRKLDERHQRALYRYYSAAGAGGIAVAVHTTQFAIRDPKHALFQPVLQFAAEEMKSLDATRSEPLIRIAGVCGPTPQATTEAHLAASLNYHAALLSLAALRDATEDQLLAHCRAVADILPIVGFYLQPAVGGRILPYTFWRRLCDEIENLVAIKIAPFNRYQTLDVMRAVAESGRDDIALYTGNDDNIVADLTTPFRLPVKGQLKERRITGGLLGHWSVWTKRAVELLSECHAAAKLDSIPADLLAKGIAVTDTNAAFFDASNKFAGCIPGLHEILRRQGLLAGIWCLDEHETLSPGQLEQINRVHAAYPHLNDDAFVAEHLDDWLR